ncbi:MAG: radical SAM protein [Chitinophagaceae bacterium]
MSILAHSPFLLYSDGKGHIFEDRSLYAMGRSGYDALSIPLESWIPLPEGGCLYELPERIPLGMNYISQNIEFCQKGWAVAAFIPPAYTGLFLSAYAKKNNALDLPLFCYTAVGWYEGKFYIAAICTEQDIRQECKGFDNALIHSNIDLLYKQFPHNRLVKHLGEKCTKDYECPAAKNYFMNRWECPIPTSSACNANCVGCISFQPEETNIVSTQNRLQFKPTVEEIVEYTVAHLNTAPFPIVSFGQGCEGEPLLMGNVLESSILEIRKHTNKGCIHINTNASKPDVIEKLCKAGLNSIRISLNSAQSYLYHKYYKPNNYSFENVLESISIAQKYDLWISLNYFIFPGITDTEKEYNALVEMVKKYHINLIQCRNLNIDPDWYLSEIDYDADEPLFGIKNILESLQEDCPWVKLGYFNPSIERIKGDWNKDFAHCVR